ncbi:hypothetical protein ACFQ0M_40955 [Kitasatospora aburaviensis]
MEPGEVEAAIRELPAVRDCAVGGEAAAGGQRRLVALVVPREGAPLSRRTLLDHLRPRLPHYLVPARIELLERLPLTSNGKVDVAGALAGLAVPEAGPAEAAGAERGTPSGRAPSGRAPSVRAVPG